MAKPCDLLLCVGPKKPNRNQKVLNSKKTKSSYPTSLYAWRYCTTSRYLVWRVFVFLIFPPASSASSGFLLKQMSAGEVKFTISLNIKSKKLKLSHEAKIISLWILTNLFYFNLISRFWSFQKKRLRWIF